MMEDDHPAWNVALGRRGEANAERWLRARGWSVIVRNHREGRREIDLVVFRGDVLAFVEVKTRRGDAYGDPFAAITRRKQAEVRRAAGDWLRSSAGRGWLSARSRTVGGGITVRFDAVAVRVDPSGRFTVEHLPDAWR